MLCRTIILSYCLLIAGVSAAESQICEWETAGFVKEEFKTPLGKLYRLKSYRLSKVLPGMREFGLYRYQNESANNIPTNCVYIRLYRNSKAEKKRTRYTVIDFKIRISPLSPPENEEKPYRDCFEFGWSDNKQGILKNSDIRYYDTFFNYCGKRKVTYLSNTTDLRGDALGGANFPVASPVLDSRFGVYDCRFIFDAQMELGTYYFKCNEIMKTILNLPSAEVKDMSTINSGTSKFQAPELNSFAISSSRDVKIELSSAIVYHAKETSEFAGLPKQQYMKYPYSRYKIMENKEIKDNPEIPYLQALELLYGKNRNWSEGIKLLRQAMHDHHSLAEFELGLCYYRGIGVPQDEKLAVRYLTRAAEAGVEDAARLLILMKLKASWPNSLDEVRKITLPLGGIQSSEPLSTWKKYGSVKQQYVYAAHYYNYKPGPRIIITRGEPQVYRCGDNQATPELAKKIMGSLNDYGPAILYEALLRRDNPQSAISLLKSGEELGSVECLLYRLIFQHEIKSLKLTDIQNEHYVKLLEYPEFWLLIHRLKSSTADPDMVEGASALGEFMVKRRDLNNLIVPMPMSETVKLRKAIEKLEKAFSRGNREAGYLLALLAMKWKLTLYKVTELQAWLDTTDNPGAAMLQAQFLQERGKLDQALSIVKKLDHLNIPEIYDLVLQYSIRLLGIERIPILYWEKAADAGSLMACRQVGDVYDAGGSKVRRNPEKSRLYREKLLKLDTDARNQDIYDLDFREKDLNEILFFENKVPGGWITDHFGGDMKTTYESF